MEKGVQRLLPPNDTSITSSLFDNSFIVVSSQREIATLKLMGIQSPSLSDFYINHFFSNLTNTASSTTSFPSTSSSESVSSFTMDTNTRDLQMVHILNQMGGLMAERSDFGDILKKTKFVPNEQGDLFTPSELYDPTISTLHDLLDGACFPFGRLSQPSCLISLRQLGLRSEMTPQGLLSSVHSVVRASTNGGEYLSEGAAREWSTVVKICIPPPSFNPVSLFLSRSPLFKTPKQVFFNPIHILTLLPHFFSYYYYKFTFFHFNVNFFNFYYRLRSKSVAQCIATRFKQCYA